MSIKATQRVTNVVRNLRDILNFLYETMGTKPEDNNSIRPLVITSEI